MRIKKGDTVALDEPYNVDFYDKDKDKYYSIHVHLYRESDFTEIVRSLG